MSIQAVRWVIEAEISPAPAKLVMLMLANYCDEAGYCYPSIAKLVQLTSLDRKTVGAALAKLCEMGLIVDSGKRVGLTGQVVVYQVTALPYVGTQHYVYRLTDQESGQFYIGCRTTNVDPHLDPYRGSGKWPQSVIAAGHLLVKEVIEIYETREEAEGAEKALIRSFDQDENCMNLDKPSLRRATGRANWEKSTRNGTVPKTDGNKPEFPIKESQKRDTEPVTNLSGNLFPKTEEVQTDDKPRRRSSLPPDSPTSRDREAAMAYWRSKGREDLCASIDRSADKFRAYHEGKGTLAASWPATWRTWYVNQIDLVRPPAGYTAPHGGNDQPTAPRDPATFTLDDWIVRVRMAQDDPSKWLPAWGEPPASDVAPVAAAPRYLELHRKRVSA